MASPSVPRSAVDFPDGPTDVLSDGPSDGARQALGRWAVQAQGRGLVARAARALAPARVMPLKGVLLGAVGAVHPATRPMRDVDLLVEGLSETRALWRLRAAGFALRDVPRSPGAFAVSHPSVPNLWVDIHTRLAPPGLGRLAPGYLFETARADDTLFGARVWLPSRDRMAVQLIVNVIKDRVVHASETAPRDITAVLLQCTDAELDAIARDLTRLSLRSASAVALLWVRERAGGDGVADLLARLRFDSSQLDHHQRSLSGRARRDHGGYVARLRGRAIADDASLRLLAILAAAAGVPLHPLRRGWLAAQAQEGADTPIAPE